MVTEPAPRTDPDGIIEEHIATHPELRPATPPTPVAPLAQEGAEPFSEQLTRESMAAHAAGPCPKCEDDGQACAWCKPGSFTTIETAELERLRALREAAQRVADCPCLSVTPCDELHALRAALTSSAPPEAQRGWPFAPGICAWCQQPTDNHAADCTGVAQGNFPGFVRQSAARHPEAQRDGEGSRG